MATRSTTPMQTAPLTPPCWCGQPYYGQEKVDGKDKSFCKTHAPRRLVHFQASALAHMNYGQQKLKAARRAQAEVARAARAKTAVRDEQARLELIDKMAVAEAGATRELVWPVEYNALPATEAPEHRQLEDLLLLEYSLYEEIRQSLSIPAAINTQGFTE